MVKPPAPKSTDNGALVGWGVLGAIVLGILAIGQCSAPETSSSAAANAMNENMSDAIAAQDPAPPEPLSPTSVSRGISQLRLAVAAEGFSGAMIYSQNCYDGLTHQFTWAKLDICGAADMLAARSIETAETAAFASEPQYFQSEAAALRYLAAATRAGEPPNEADTRLSQLQARIARIRLVGQPSAPTDESSDELGNVVSNAIDENVELLEPTE